MFSHQEARQYVKKNISGKKATILGYFILYTIFQSVVSSLVSNKFDGTLAFFISAVVAGAITPVKVGFYRIMRNILEAKAVKFEMLFSDYKNFFNLFVIGAVCNVIINFGYKLFYIPGFFFSVIYTGILYFYVYNSDLTLEKFAAKVSKKIGAYWVNAVILELSYIWLFILISIAYVILTIIFGFIFGTGVLNSILSSFEISGGGVNFAFNVSEILNALNGMVPFVIISIVFAVIFIILIFWIYPRLLLAEAKFFSAFGNDKENDSKTKYCPECGNKIEGKFCTNCGTSKKE